MRRDLEEYLTQLQKQYNEMTKAAEEAAEMLKKGELSAEAAEPIQQYLSVINANYQRVLYCRYLVNLPPKFIQKIQAKKLRKDLEKFKEEHADKESVIEETQENLDNIKEYLPEEVEDETCGDQTI